MCMRNKSIEQNSLDTDWLRKYFKSNNTNSAKEMEEKGCSHATSKSVIW